MDVFLEREGKKICMRKKAAFCPSVTACILQFAHRISWLYRKLDGTFGQSFIC